ncbi:hypothetical protein BIV23_34825 [Streptomyces monashensis]|uniref:Uncharacterized protein n=1 Tax=Streptomyces monashensis TaxID=1678012 RepID=A0A1S2PPM3_9ACTN|nr:hypothetical protein BIV23_34825 [Streptomyces monashensis]
MMDAGEHGVNERPLAGGDGAVGAIGGLHQGGHLGGLEDGQAGLVAYVGAQAPVEGVVEDEALAVCPDAEGVQGVEVPAGGTDGAAVVVEPGEGVGVVGAPGADAVAGEPSGRLVAARRGPSASISSMKMRMIDGGMRASPTRSRT